MLWLRGRGVVATRQESCGNGGSIIESITYNTETIMHPKKNRPIKALNITINYNTNKIYDNTDPQKKPYLFKVLGKP